MFESNKVMIRIIFYKLIIRVYLEAIKPTLEIMLLGFILEALEQCRLKLTLEIMLLGFILEALK